MTIKELLNEGVEMLSISDGALLNCEVLLGHVLGYETEQLITNCDEEVEDNLAKLFLEYIRRVDDGEPVEHITNSKEFYGLDFYVDNRVLIPRPETEQIVERLITYIDANQELGRHFRLLDVGTGSGNIPISVLSHYLGRSDEVIDYFDALEVSEEALEVARINAGQHGIEDKIRLLQSDLLEVIDEGQEYDAIVANLPYIGEEKHRFVSAAAQKYEPNVALFGGNDGLQLYRRMFEELRDKNIGFELMMGEFGFAQSEDMAELLAEFYEGRSAIVPDLAGIDRIFIVGNLSA
jgi:release factor glutamine methyltransferase